MSIIEIGNLDVIFGKKQGLAWRLMDQGKNRAEIMEETGQIVGVHDVCLSIKRGEIFVLMGLSGSGKSTLLRTINGLLPITRGRVDLFLHQEGEQRQIALASASAASIRHLRLHHIAMVFQKFALLPWKTVKENVAFGLEISRTPLNLIEQRVKASLHMVGLANWHDRYPASLSGGMQQRVGLARALATDADILLMDEPFSALDPLIKSNLQQELLHLQKTLNKTIIFVTHDLDEALKLGNRIAIMQDGKVVQVGSAEEIVSQPKTPYVRDFVAHIDHTKLLRAKALMTSINELKIHEMDAAVVLDSAGTYRCVLDEAGRPRRIICGDVAGRIVPWSLFQSGSFTDKDMVAGNEHLMIKDVIHAVGLTKKPMVIKDQSGKMIGAITTESILSALAMK